MLWEFLDNFLKDKVKVAITLITLIVLFGLMVVLWPREDQQTVVNPTLEAELVIWEPNFEANIYREVVSDFEAKYRGIDIEIVQKDYENDYYKDLISNIARDSGPDIFAIRNDDLPAYKEFMLPISLFRGESLSNYKSDFVDLVVRDTIDRDSVYGVTFYVDNIQLYYNKDALSQGGIALPAKTWDDLDEQLNDLNKRSFGGDDFRESAISLGTGSKNLGSKNTNIKYMEDLAPLLIFQSGGQIYDYGNQRSTLNQSDKEEALEALKFYLSFADPLDERYSWSNSSDDNLKAFTEEKLVYMLGYANTRQEIEEINPVLNYEVAEIPQIEGNSSKTFGRFSMLGMNRKLEDNSDKKQAAELFLEYLATPEVQEKLTAKTELPGARRDIIEKQRDGDKTLRIFALGALYADNYYKPNVERNEQMWRDLFYKVHFETGKYTSNSSSRSILSAREEALEEAFDEMVDEYELTVKQDPVLR